MKKFYMTMVAMLCGVAAFAQGVDELYIYANEVKVDKGATAGVLPVCLRNSIPVSAISFRVELPEGVTVKASRGKMSYALTSRAEGYSVDYQLASDGNAQISVYDIYPFFEEDGAIINVDLNITPEASAEDATLPVKFYAISMSAPKVGNPSEVDWDPAYNDGRSYGVSGELKAENKEATSTLTVGAGTGINSINAEDSKAPIYNVAGQRVSKAQKGVFIQNGKKVAVK